MYDYSGIYGKFCNVTTETVTIRSVKNYVWVRFYSDSDRVLGSGINVAYKHVSEGMLNTVNICADPESFFRGSKRISHHIIQRGLVPMF